MKLTNLYIGIACFTLTLQSCVKDLQDDLNDEGWNHERTVVDILLENQVGTAAIETIDASIGEIEVTINTSAVSDLSAVKLKKLQLSYQATASLTPGEALNFNNDSRTAAFTVTSATGEQRKYTVHVTEFTESLIGTWEIQKLTVFGGTGLEYGGGRVYQLTDKPWCWSAVTGPGAEYDNTLTFTLTGISEEGNTSGTCVNDAGADGKYADFIFSGEQNKDNPGTALDLKKFYRQIPEGTSTWVRDYAAGTVTFTDTQGKTTTCTFLNAGTEDLGYDLSMKIDDNAFAATLQGTDDWVYIYTDFDCFAKKVRKYWISVKKK